MDGRQNAHPPFSVSIGTSSSSLLLLFMVLINYDDEFGFMFWWGNIEMANNQWTVIVWSMSEFVNVGGEDQDEPTTTMSTTALTWRIHSRILDSVVVV